MRRLANITISVSRDLAGQSAGWRELLEPEVPSVLSHYTDLNGALGMLDSRTFWLTNFRYLNDFTEISQFLHRCLMTLEGSKPFRSAESQRWDASLSNLFGALLNNFELRIFVVSFSEKADQLSQWRAYGGEFDWAVTRFPFRSIDPIPDCCRG